MWSAKASKADLLAGLSLAGLMLPESVAYAAIAGLEPSRAVIAGICGCLAYAVFGQSRFAIVAPTSSSAAILAATLASLQADGVETGAAATLAVLMVGLLFLAASLLRLGNLTGFISRPVLRGFAFGLAITIILHQLPVLLGLSVHAGDLWHFIVALIQALPQVNANAAGIGLGAVVLLLLLKRLPMLPGPLLVLAGSIGLALVFDLKANGVALVGDIPLVPGWPVWPQYSFEAYSRMAQLAMPLALILFAESWGTIRGFAVKHGDDVNSNRELAALGFANVVSAIGRGMPVGAGFSAGSAAETAGGQSGLTGVIAACGLMVMVLAGARFVALIPEPVPAAVVIVALLHALDLRPFIRLWRIDRDNHIAGLTALGILVFGVLNGMLIAIALSLGALIARLAQPKITALGRLGQGRDYVDLSRHDDASPVPHMLILRPAAPLFYANADTVLRSIASRARADASVRTVIISLEESPDLDSTALDLLLEFDRSMRNLALDVRYARVHDHIRDLVALAGAQELLQQCYYSVDDAVRGGVAAALPAME